MKREVNIISKAIENGFEIDQDDSFEEVVLKCENYLIEEELDVIEEHVKIEVINGVQRVDWSDGQGFDFWLQGEIVDFSKHWSDSPETKVFYETVIDSNCNVVKMYYLVGKTDYNQENITRE